MMRYNPLGKKFRNTTGFWTCAVAAFTAIFFAGAVAWRLFRYPNGVGLICAPVAVAIGAAVVALTVLFSKGLGHMQDVYAANPSPALEESASYLVRIYVIGVLSIAVALQLSSILILRH
ncbi:MAG: hypothetical protein ACYC92_06250 [Candidatus Acidiferrales bacterium]